MVGTPLYMAPQILKSQPYTVKSDIWSLGLIFYEMLYGKLPYTARSQYELITKIDNMPL
jgi:serine/threonine-protein kinase ULK/ATG1